MPRRPTLNVVQKSGHLFLFYPFIQSLESVEKSGVANMVKPPETFPVDPQEKLGDLGLIRAAQVLRNNIR